MNASSTEARIPMGLWRRRRKAVAGAARPEVRFPVGLGRRRAAAEVEAALPDLLERVAGELRAGASLLRALAAWAEDRPLPAVAAAAAALEVAAGAGGPAAPALEGLAAGLRDRHDAAGEVAALSAQARLSAVVVGAAPVASLALSLLADRRVAPTLIGTGSGRACLVTGTALEALAALWMRRIVRCDA